MKPEKQLYQWDVNQYLTGINPAAQYVDYTIDNEVIRLETDGTRCRIPDEVLQTYGGKTCYERYPDGTYRAYSFTVLYAPKPPEYVYTPEERTTFEALTARVDAAIDEIKRRADSGEFTPVKGVDYFTDAEKTELMEGVSSGAVGEFRKVVDTATIEYNDNHNSKLAKYNDNASEKLTTYDTNAEQHTTDYNRNAEQKLEAYNQNHTEKVAEYNANAETKTAEFDSNAAEKLKAYNDNADNKVAEFDSHTEQIQTDINGLKSDIVNKIDAPENPTVGKILKIKSVNEDGTFVCEWADDEIGAVDDVQINGTSIVADGVANIPIAGASKVGLVKISTSNNSGIFLGADGNVQIDPANDTQISARLSISRPINPSHLDHAVKAAMCDGKGAEWTAEEQAMARARMDADGGTMELLVDAVLEEDAKTFVVQIPKSCEEIIYHTWTFNDSGANLSVRHYVGDDSSDCLARYATFGNGSGISTNGYAKHIGNIESYSIIGYSTYSISSNWTSDNNGNGESLYMTYPHYGVITKISRFKMSLDTGMLKAGTVIRIWGR